ncbi:ribonuclease I [Acinetobacter sp. SFB]|uniref:ribonuclease T2 family protein n=1 Tax=Acinetobacter sp. SFB TaxID=1805634 RepID=UPI0007D86733|nr:ribonuclease I [Acinetobacter sp. SFB]OAL77719.1 ribonuclease I [Acinetobacter sp. SFB]
MIFFDSTPVLARLALFVASGAGLGLCSSHSFAAPLLGYVMVVQMTPAVCMLDNQKSKKRKCLEGYSLNISGLLPETAESECKTSASAVLSPLQARVVARVMPDENARIQLWQTIGGCVPMNASQYFRTVINYAERLKVPAELTSPENRTMHISNLRLQFLRLNPSLPSSAIKFNCAAGNGTPILTEVKLCYKPNGQYKQCSAAVEMNCPSSFTIKGSY